MDVLHQISKMPKDATHVYLLVGTNNVMNEEAHTISHKIVKVAARIHVPNVVVCGLLPRGDQPKNAARINNKIQMINHMLQCSCALTGTTFLPPGYGWVNNGNSVQISLLER